MSSIMKLKNIESYMYMSDDFNNLDDISSSSSSDDFNNLDDFCSFSSSEENIFNGGILEEVILTTI